LNHLLQINHHEPTRGVKNHLLNTTIFIIGIEWYEPIIKYLGKGILKMIHQEKKIVELTSYLDHVH
jgi:hypothetical protein